MYKGEDKEDYYLYLPHEFNDAKQEDYPKALLDMLGELSLVIEFDLSQPRTLPQADIEQVRSDIDEHGFYLQMPKKDMKAEENRYFN